jgi:hypothetical protein
MMNYEGSEGDSKSPKVTYILGMAKYGFKPKPIKETWLTREAKANQDPRVGHAPGVLPRDQSLASGGPPTWRPEVYLVIPREGSSVVWNPVLDGHW